MGLSPRVPKKKAFFFAFLFSGILLFLASISPGNLAAKTAGLGSPKPRGKIVIFVINQVSLDDLSKAKIPHIKWLIKKGAPGAMNTRTPLQESTSAAYTTIGAGNKALGLGSRSPGGSKAWEGFNSQERIGNEVAADIYKRRTGQTLSPYSLANLSITQIIQADLEENLGAKPGSLGDALHAAGFKTAAIGNSDTSTEFGRSVVNLVMDSSGKVDYGDVSRAVLQEDSASPSGLRTDSRKLFLAFEDAYSKTDVIAVEWGDTPRLEAENIYLSPAVGEKAKRDALQRADRFLGRILKSMNLKKDRIIVIAPSPSEAALRNNDILTPVLMTGDGVTRGILTSEATRQDGIIVNTDIAPTILKFYGLNIPAQMIGQPAYGKSFSQDPLSFLVSANRKWVDKRNFSAPVLKTFVVWSIFIMLMAMVLLLVPSYRPHALRIRPLLLSIPIVPSVFLILPLFDQKSLFTSFIAAIFLTAFLTTLIWWTRKDTSSLVVIGLIAVGLVSSDLFSGAYLAQASLLGYSFIGGSRFYGIGNEYMGVIIGATVVSLSLFLDKSQFLENNKSWISKAAIMLLLAGIAFVVGSPLLGANFGGLLAVVAAFGFAYLGFLKRKVSFRDALLLIIGGLIITSGFILLDVVRGASSESHIGRLIHSIQAQGFDPLIQIIQRKVTTNIKLFQFAFWNWVNVSSFVILLVAFYGLKNLLKLVFQRYPYFKWGLVGGIAGSVAALIFNDSGVVAMATIFVFLIPSTLYLMAKEGQEPKGELKEAL